MTTVERAGETVDGQKDGAQKHGGPALHHVSVVRNNPRHSSATRNNPSMESQGKGA